MAALPQHEVRFKTTTARACPTDVCWAFDAFWMWLSTLSAGILGVFVK
jgi:hypothetical protein